METDKTQALMTLINIVIGFAISLTVSALKKIEIVNNNPKSVAALLSAIGGVLLAYFGRGGDTSILLIAALSFIGQLVTAIGTFETVIKPASAAMGNEKEPK